MDALVRGTNPAETLRVVTAVTTDLVREACARHGCLGVEAIVLGRALTVGCLLATLTKNDDERVRILFRGKGALGRILVDAYGSGAVRGFVEKKLEEPVQDQAAQLSFAEGLVRARASVGPFVGPTGQLVVTRDIGLENPYQGTVTLRSGEIDEDLEYYLESSEQIPSTLGAEVLVDGQGQVRRAAGILCQTFPGADPSTLAPLRTLLRSSTLGELLAHERSPEDLVGLVTTNEGATLGPTTPLRFECGCDLDRALVVLATLGADEVESMADEPGDTEVVCNYCNAHYEVSSTHLRTLARRIRSERS